MTISIGIRVSGRQRLVSLGRRLREAADGGLQRDLAVGVQVEAVPALAATKAAWAGIEVESTRGGGSSSGIRGRAAAATGVTPTAKGVHFEVEPSVIDPVYGKSLSFGLNGMGRWRHPVWGTRKWTQQYGEEVFLATLRGYEPQWHARLERVCEETARRIEG